jgi:hypothetical protein
MKFDYICIKCGQLKKTVRPDKIVCDNCRRWNKPGINQLSLKLYDDSKRKS